MKFERSADFARQLDNNDNLSSFRNEFYIPTINQKQVKYFTGNSLGLQPKSARDFVEQEFYDWQNLGVEGHTHAKNPWLYYHHFLTENAAEIVGAKKEEVVIMNNLTANLHLMMVSFYQPSAERYKILMEASAFPSDQYAVESQVRFHGFEPDDAIIEVHPREGEFTIRHEDIIEILNEQGNESALVMFGGVNYYTGQLFNMQLITAAAHEAGAMVGFDLAHAAGNVILNLHDWNVDFAVWCSYKYLNSGPGGTSGVFVHERHANNHALPRFAGWWGHNEKDRFLMKKGFDPIPGAQGWQLSNAQIFPMAIHRASLEIFHKAGLNNLRNKSILLTNYLEFLLNQINEDSGVNEFKIITPKNAEERGCQLSILVQNKGKEAFDFLMKNGVVTDWREPNVIRMAPVPLYNSFTDVFEASEILRSFYIK